MWRDAALVAAKDLRIEARSRVGLSQIVPFGVVALGLFAFALGPNRSLMVQAAPGLFWVAVLFLFGARVHLVWLLALSSLLGAVGLAATGTLYGALSAGLRVKETLLPFLLLPIVAPVLLAGTRMWEAAAVGGVPSSGTDWLRLLLVFDAVYLALGVVIFGPIQESA